MTAHTQPSHTYFEVPCAYCSTCTCILVPFDVSNGYVCAYADSVLADALKPLLGVKLMGPYDFLAGLFADESILSVKSVHLHHRFYFDQPELLTILAEDKEDGQHLGYFRYSADRL